MQTPQRNLLFKAKSTITTKNQNTQQKINVEKQIWIDDTEIGGELDERLNTHRITFTDGFVNFAVQCKDD